MKLHTLKDFEENVGKVVFRDNNKCSCATCADVLKNGLTIIDLEHARYLYDTQCDFAVEGLELNYRDNK